jgi:ribosome-binding protein aMBF1 (putative translation factor)
MSGDEPDGVNGISSAQCRAARAWLGWHQTELASRSGVGLSAIKDFEGENRRTNPSIRRQLQRTFEDAGAEFPDEHSMRVQPGNSD